MGSWCWPEWRRKPGGKVLSSSTSHTAHQEQVIPISLSPSGSSLRLSFLQNHPKSGTTTEQSGQKLSISIELWFHPSRTGPRKPNTTKATLNHQGSGQNVTIIFNISRCLGLASHGVSKRLFSCICPCPSQETNSLKWLIVLSGN